MNDLSRRAYGLLLRLQPRELRAEYGAAMSADFDRMIADARHRRLRFPVLRVWLRVLADHLTAALQRRPGHPRRPAHRDRSDAPPNRESPMGNFSQDLRFALRVLRRQPMFVLVAALTVALGVSATATIFSAANSLLLRSPSGVQAPSELVTVHRIDSQGTGFHAFGIPWYRAMAAADAIPDLAAFDVFEGGLTLDDVSSRVSGAVVSGSYFRVVGTRAAHGRLFGPAEDSLPGRDAVVVISHSLWERRFDGSNDAVGRRIRLNGADFTVIGVAEAGFQGHLAVLPTEVWVPVSAQGLVFGAEDLSEEAATSSVELVARLHPNQSVEQAHAALDAAGATVAESRGMDWHGVDVLGYSPIFAVVHQPMLAFFAALFAVAGVLLTITAINVANMLLSRGAARSQEIGMRLALGATRSRLVAQLLTESAVLFLLGGIGGVVLTYWWTGLIGAFRLPLPVTLNLDVTPDLRVLAFALAVAGVTGLVFGLSPALNATRVDLVTSIRDSATASGRRRLRNVLVFAQVAGSAVLLVSAGLLVRSLGAAGSTELGLEPAGVSVLFVDVDAAGRDAETKRRFFADALEQARATPGVESAATIDVVPLTLSNAQTRVVLPDLPPEPELGIQRVEAAGVSPGYFETVRIPLLSGRDFSATDTRESPTVVIVNETLAEYAWPGESPVGKRMGLGSVTEPIDVEIIGLARDSKIRSAGDPPRMLVYTSAAQFGGDATLLIRASTDAAIATVRERVRALDPVLPPAFVVPYPELAGVSMLPSRLAATLAGSFGLVGTLLAGVGLYGLLAFAVAQRSREIGVRMALGAGPGSVQRLFLTGALKVISAGLLAGLIAAAAVAQLLRSLLFGVSPFDPTTYVGITAVLLGVATLASWLPARRAAHIDPASALRRE